MGTGPFPRLKAPSDLRPLQVPAQATSALEMYICIRKVHTCELISCNDISSTAPSAWSLSGNCPLDIGLDEVLNKAFVPGRRNLLEAVDYKVYYSSSLEDTMRHVHHMPLPTLICHTGIQAEIVAFYVQAASDQRSFLSIPRLPGQEWLEGWLSCSVTAIIRDCRVHDRIK